MKTPIAKKFPRRPAYNPPAWRRAAARGAAATLHTVNPYAYGSQCWVVFEHNRPGGSLFAPLAPLRGHPSASV